MAIDYSMYTSWYNFMDSVFRQIQTYSGNYGGIYGNYSNYGNNTAAQALSFAQQFQNARTQTQNLNVPERMDAIFEEAAQTYNVPVQLLKAIGKAESDFDPNVVSSAGAQGVMQLMPGTARELGVTDPFDARENIFGGAKYISQMLNRYNGNIELALAAYNAGSGNVDKYGGVPPFSETQNYVRIVQEYMGENITTGKTVATQNQNSSGVLNNGYANGWNSTYANGISSQDALYMIELMKLQLQNRMTMASQSILSGSGSNSLWNV